MFFPAPSNEPCGLAPEAGRCKALKPMYYFDASDDTCKSFNYGGCGGNANKFETKKLCEYVCKKHSRQNHSFYLLNRSVIKLYCFQILLTEKVYKNVRFNAMQFINSVTYFEQPINKIKKNLFPRRITTGALAILFFRRFGGQKIAYETCLTVYNSICLATMYKLSCRKKNALYLLHCWHISCIFSESHSLQEINTVKKMAMAIEPS